MSAAKPRHWSYAILAKHIGAPKHEMPGLKRAVTQLMEDHGKLNQNYKLMAARDELRCFLLSNLDKLPVAVHDAGSNPVHEKTLMGLAVYANGKNGQSAGCNKVATQATNTSSPEASDDDPAENSDSNDETKERLLIANQGL